MPARKPKRGGRRPGAGRPVGSVTTGSDGTKRVVYRVSAAQRAELDAEGARLGVSGDLAAKRRAFPSRGD